MKRNNLARLWSLALLLVLLAAVSVAGAQDSKVLVTGISMVGGDIETIDPGLAEASSHIEVINQIFLGLTSQNVINGESELGLATSFEVSDDGKIYTFQMLENVPWVRYNAETDAVEEIKDENGNTRYVTAEDVKYGMLRSLSPETASPYAYVLVPYVEGAEAYNGGSGSADDVKIEVVDTYTITITSPDSVSFTPSIYGLWMSRPQPQWAIEEGGDSWTEPESIATNGPFALKEWNHDESIVVVKNPFWPGTDAVPQSKLDEVVFRFLDPQQQFAEYLAGNMDAIQVPLEEIERARTDAVLSKEFSTGTNPCT